MVLTLRFPESNLARIAPNLSGDPVRLTKSPNIQYPTDWSRDGQFILFYEITPGTQRDLWILPLTGGRDRQPRRYAGTAANESWGRFSPEPNPRWIAYQSDESGRFQVYVQAFPEPGRKFRISPRGGSHPKWGPGGRELYYETLDNKLVVVNLTLEAGTVETSAPRELFDLPSADSGATGPVYDIAPDGKRFAVRVDLQSGRGLTLVTNWPALIKKGSAGR
jgi:Tol biopolymer transport system component